MGSIPVDMALLLLIEKAAADDAELTNQFDIYNMCSKKTCELAVHCTMFLIGCSYILAQQHWIHVKAPLKFLSVEWRIQ
jgi:hypothetical protein